jgi:WD40 repeat protein
MSGYEGVDDEGAPERPPGFDIHASRDAYVANRDIYLYIGDRPWRVASASSRADTGCPYPGLAAFDVKDAGRFFGREELTARLLARVNDCLTEGGPLMVVAPSGAGKSSLLRAGLLHKITEGGLTPAGSRDWPQVKFTPGARPLRAAADELMKCPGVAEGAGVTPEMFPAEPRPGDLDRLLARALAAPPSAGVKNRDAPVRGAPGARAVIVVDQFEELFRLCESEAEREAFIAWLGRISGADGPGGPRALVVCGLRADFYARCVRYPLLCAALQSRQVLVGAMSDEELRRVITYPARATGLEVQDGLVEVLLRDLRRSPIPVPTGPDDQAAASADYDAGRLPLLAHALELTWQQRQGSRLTIDGYQAAGGIEDAIAQRAERVYASLGEPAQREARALFLSLVKIGDSSDQDVRQPVSHFDPVASGDAAGAVVEAFARERLLTPARNGVQITHEALLHAWPTLRDWLAEDRARSRIRRETEDAAKGWEGAADDSAYLFRGTRLDDARAWAAGHQQELSQRARRFLRASYRQARLSALSRRVGIAVLFALTLVAVAAAVYAGVQQRAAVRQQRTAAAQALLALESGLRASQVGQALMLGIAAMKVSPPDQAGQARSTLIRTLIGSHAPAVLPGDGSEAFAVAFSPAGHRLLVAAARSWSLWDVTARPHPKLIVTVPTPGGSVWAAAFTPDGRLLATVSPDGTTVLRDVADPARELGRLTTWDGTWVTSVAFSPDGRRMLTGTWDNSAGGRSAAYLWDVSSPSRPGLIARLWRAGTGQVRGVAFSHDGGTAYTADDDGTVGIWDTTLARPAQAGVLHAHSNTVHAVAVSPDGRTMLTGSTDQTAALWDLSDPRRPERLAILAGHRDAVRAVAFSPDGVTVATASLDGTAILWRIADRSHPIRLDTLSGDTEALWGVAFSADGKTIATTSSDGSAITWDAADRVQPARLASLPGIGPCPSADEGTTPILAYSPDGHILAEAGPGPKVVLWDAANPRSPRKLGFFSTPGCLFTIAYLPGGQVLATGGDDGTVMLWNVATPATPTRLASANFGSGISSLGFTPDGTLLAIGDDAGAVALVNVTHPDAPQLLSAFTATKAPVRLTAFTGDGRTLAVGSVNAFFGTWDVTSHRHPRQLSGRILTNSVYFGTFAPGGRTLAVAEDGRKTTLWDIASRATPRLLVTLHKQSSSIYTAGFSPDGQLLATGGFDRTVIIWDSSDTRNPQELLKISGFPAPVAHAVFSPDGKTLAISGGSTPTLWDISSLHDIVAQPIAAACDITGHGLDPGQWQAYAIGFKYQPTCLASAR